MTNPIEHTELHRTAKYFMDNGRAKTHEEALKLLQRFGLTIQVGPEITSSRAHQAALLSLVNLASRTLLAGVEVIGIPEDTISVSSLAQSKSLMDAVLEFGGMLASEPHPKWPNAIIGTVTPSNILTWQVTWEGWRGGVVPLAQHRRLKEDDTMALAPILAAAVCAAEVFAWHAEDHAMAGRRDHGLSLWQPGSYWLTSDSTEPNIAFLPSRLWLIGLGNLGQAYSWLLAALPYCDPANVQFVLQDFDKISPSNKSTSLLSFERDVGRQKARVLAEWFERRGFKTVIEERYFGEWTRRNINEPGVALCSVDNALARSALEDAGFDFIVEAGLGAGPAAFRSISVHTFPGSSSAKEIWSNPSDHGTENPEHMPAYQKLKSLGMDECGLTQLATRTVGVPFVGLIAACLVVSELLRRLHGNEGMDFAACSALALHDIEKGSVKAGIYEYGYVDAAKSEQPTTSV